MPAERKSTSSSKLFKMVVGVIFLILGVSAILLFWPEVTSLFKGAAGIILAIGGLAVLYTLKD